MTDPSPKTQLIDTEFLLSQRSYNVITEFGKYFFRMRDRSTADAFLSMATALEKQALQIWEKSDTLELEDLIALLEKQPPTPEKAPRFRGSVELQVSANLANGFDGVGAGSIAREQDVKVGEVALAQAVVDVEDFLCRGFGAAPLLVGRVVACWLGGCFVSFSGLC